MPNCSATGHSGPSGAVGCFAIAKNSSAYYTCRVEITTAADGASPAPANGFWHTIRSYILWQHERGTLHYDIMVTVILLFVFFSPYWINFNDKPVPRNPHPTGVIVTPDGQGGLIYQIEASAVSQDGAQPVQDQLLRIIEPISGEVSIVKYESVSDHNGKVQNYRVWVRRE
ncbi:MAG TPA: hypothetical protein VMU61_04205 [Candidatus Aquilonibacter sp.]|nr:hypothetical protein [Candidatus Aquilonibacter sp.]